MAEITIEIAAALLERLHARAAEEGRTVNEIAVEIIENIVRDHVENSGGDSDEQPDHETPDEGPASNT